MTDEQESMVYVDYLKLAFDNDDKVNKESEEAHRFLALREYYDNNDTSETMDEGQWEYPEQLELDLGIEHPEYDENTVCTEINITLVFDYKLSTQDWDHLTDVILDAVDKDFPHVFMAGEMRTGTDKELHPEDYDESTIPNSTKKEEM